MSLPAALRRGSRLLQRLSGSPDPLLLALFEDAAIGALVADRNRLVVQTNQCLRSMLPESSAALAPGAPVMALFALSDRERIAVALAGALRGDTVTPLRARLQAADATAEQAVALSLAPLREHAGISGLVLRLTDISAERRLESQLAQLQKLQAVGQLAGGIAHDFNNLLAAIIGAADSVLEREGSTSATFEDVQQIRRSADRGAALVRQLLAFGRRQPLQPSVVAVNDAIRNLSDMLGRLLGARVHLELALEDPGRSVRVDPTQLDQVLVNLAVNARDAMPDGGTLTLRTGHLTLYRPRLLGTETMPPGRYVSVEVADTGEGIPPALLPRIFEPFFTTRREHGGSGLGLSTVHGIVHQSGGFVAAESMPGTGTSLRFWLPRHDATDVVTSVPAVVVAVPARPLPALMTMQRRVLLVEDEAPVLRLAQRALQRAGWVVLAAESAEAALAALPDADDASNAPGVVVSDMMLPGMDGAALVRAVRTRWPGLPAVLVSGYTDSALLDDLTAQGVAFLPKPFRLKELVASVEVALAGGRVRD